jgi:CRP/FNR family cyclic AMP-dependent transcriptional regulator
MSEILRLKKDETLFEEGEEAENIYILRSGILEVYKGIEIVEELKPIKMVGEMSFIDKLPRQFTVRAQSACTLVVINREIYDEVFSEMPEWYMAMYDSILKRLKEMGVGEII